MSEGTFGYNERLPEPIRTNFMHLCQDVSFLQSEWDFYLELFSDEQNADLFSDIAPMSFRIIFDALQGDITMGICRLGDPPKDGKNINLSLKTLVDQCSDVKVLDRLYAEFQEACKPVERIRNKRIAHRDLYVAVEPSKNPLPGIQNEQVNLILEKAKAILNAIALSHDDSEYYFHIIGHGGADSLIYWLKEGRASNARYLASLAPNNDPFKQAEKVKKSEGKLGELGI